MKISVILPCLNAGQYITDALHSIQIQSYPAHEIVVIDNFSTDDTVKKIQESGVDVKFLQVPREGVSVSRNKGIEASTGEWVAYLDADDIWYPEHLERAHRFLSQNQDVAYLSHLDAMSPKDRKPCSAGIPPLFPEPTSGITFFRFVDRWAPRLYFSPSSVVQKKTAVLKAGGWNPKLEGPEDVELFLRVLRDGTCSYNPTADWCYQVGTPNNISSHRVRNERCMLEVLLGCEPYYHGEVLKPAIAKSAKRAMAVALMDGSPQERRRAHHLAWDRLSVSGKFFFGLSAVVPSLGRGLLWMKRKLRPVR